MNIETEIKISEERINKFNIKSIKKICEQYKFNVYDILSIAYAETSFRPDITHPVTNARGLYQMKDWAVNRTNLNLNVYDPVQATYLCCEFLKILDDVDYPKVQNMNFNNYKLSKFERLMILYHYGLNKTKKLLLSNLNGETEIYINNLKKGKKISKKILSKKKFI